MNAEIITQLIQAKLTDAIVSVNSPDNVHFEATVISSEFAGKTRVQQQQMIYAILNEYIQSGAIHALALKTMLPVNA